MVIPPIIFPKFKSNPNCPVPKLAAFDIDRSLKCNHGVINKYVIMMKESIML